MNKKESGSCIAQIRSSCTNCKEPCAHHLSTKKDLAKFGIASSVGGTKQKLPCDIIFATADENADGLYYRDLRKKFNSHRIKRAKPEEIAKTGATIGFLIITD
jgi:hypothetical protein